MSIGDILEHIEEMNRRYGKEVKMENKYYVICREDNAGNKSYVYELNNNNCYADKDYTKGLRFYNKEVAIGLSKEIKSSEYRYSVYEIKTVLTKIEG